MIDRPLGKVVAYEYQRVPGRESGIVRGSGENFSSLTCYQLFLQ